MLTFVPVQCIISKSSDETKVDTKNYGVLAQLGEHLPYKQRVTGASPVGPISIKKTWRDSSVG